MFKIDLHTHSVASSDGRITKQGYKKALDSGLLDCIAVTDHNSIHFAQSLQHELGEDKIIVGEEISTIQGDIIGLFLTEAIPENLDIKQAIKMIQKQSGLVYIPHPFETMRKGISLEILSKISDDVDIIESCNGRAFFQNRGPEVYSWAHQNRKSHCASSDAHRGQGLGKTYTIITSAPTKETLVELLKTSRLIYGRPTLGDIIAPKANRFVKHIRGGR